MVISVKLTGMAEVQALMDGFSERRFNALVATTLTRTAKVISDNWQAQLTERIDRPTPRTQSAIRIEGATATNLSAKVAVKDVASGTPPADYLMQHEYSGSRLIKKFERALMNSGAMPSGYMTVPGKGAELDGYGNVSRGQIVAVLSQIGKDFSGGYQRVISKDAAKRAKSQAKHGRRYIVAKVGHPTISPGVYERVEGRGLRAVFLFKKIIQYRRKLTLQSTGRADAQEIAAKEFDRALTQTLARLASR